MSNELTLRLQQFREIATLSAFDISTEEGRSKERHRRILLTAAASGISKVVSVATSLISIPLTLHYLGTERFGLWMTISSIIAMLSVADLGVGNGLLNAISEAYGKDDRESMRRYISSAFVILSGVAMLVILAFVLIYPIVPWQQLFNVKSALAVQESGQSMAVFMLCFALGIPAGIVQRVQAGLQMGFVANLWGIAESMSGLFAVLAAIHFNMGLPWLVGAMAGAPVLIAVFNGLVFFGRVFPSLRPGFHLICATAVKKVMHTGLLFLMLQVAVSIAFASDNLVIARILGSESVAQYAVPAKLFNVISLLASFVLVPLWSAYGEAISRGDGLWVRNALIKSMKIAFVFSLCLSFFGVLFGKSILALWVGHQVSTPFMLLLGFGVWKVLECLGNTVSAFLNVANGLRLQLISACLMTVSCILLKIFLVRIMGISGAVWATVMAYTVVTVLPMCYFVPRFLKVTLMDSARRI